MEQNTIKKIFEKTISILFFLVISFLLFLSIFNTSTISADYTEVTFYIKDNTIRNVLIVCLFCVFVFVLSKSKTIKKFINTINNDDKLFLIIKFSILGVSLLLTLFWIITAFLYPEADQYSVQLLVDQMRKGNYSGFEVDGYLGRYPFQSGIVLISYFLSFILGTQNFIAMEIINVLLVIIFYYELSIISKILGANNFERLLIVFSSLFFPILLFYCYFIYGTIPGLVMCVLSFKHFLLFNRDRKNKDILLCGVFTALALLFKTNYLIYLIAIIIAAILKLLANRDLKTLILIIVLCLSSLFQSVIPVKIIESISNKELGDGMSNMSWIAMGLQEGERAPGWYNGYNNDSFSEANNNHNKQKKIAIQSINKRINEFNRNPSYAIEFFIKKIDSQWNNPTFQVFWNLDGKIYKESTRDSWAMHFIEKQGQYQFQKILNIIQTILLFGVFVYSIVALNNDYSIENLFFELFFIGGFLFQLIWEGKAQYTFVYFVLLIPYSIKGYTFLIAKKRIQFKPVIIFEAFIIIVILFLFANRKFEYLSTDNTKYYNYIYDIQEY